MQRANQIDANSACPKCGAIYSKVEAFVARAPKGSSRNSRGFPSSAELEAKPKSSLYQRVADVMVAGVICILGYQGFKYYKEQKMVKQRNQI